MNKMEAAQIMHLNDTASAAEIEARYLRIAAFLSGGDDCGNGLKSLAEQAKTEFDLAYDALPKQQSGKSQPQDTAPKTDQKQSDLSAKKSFLFPQPIESAGELFSEQWWRVYQRVVVVGLLLCALALDQIPKLFHQEHKPDPIGNYVPPYETPPQTPGSIPFGQVGPPPDSSMAPSTQLLLTNPQPTTQTIDPSLNPTPNPNPLVIAPTQTPQAFLIGLFWAIKGGNDTQSMIKQPSTLAVSQMLLTNHSQSPTLDELSQDAFQILSQTSGAATVRVNESYFTGMPQTNDYYLVSDNGVWKLSDIQTANGVLH